ncbi:MAG: hypothetical protein E3I25_06100 [Dehalococcoidia bacterium]|jgi:hypothetical protein|nr:MAG: hypothetical protein E3I25_06100 [Dehalococcoidia bacterium]
MTQGYFVCHSCGKTVEHTEEERPCQVLNGWLMVSRWKGPGTVEHYNFCSSVCLKRWTDTQVPQVPDVFLKAFDKGKD